MPLPERLARFNRRFANRILRPVAARSPGFCLLIHRGRRSGRVYRTPLNAFRQRERIIVALTYGPEVDWLKNANASDGSEIILQGQRLAVGAPQRIGTEEGLGAVPSPVRAILIALGVTDFVAFPIT